MREYEKFNLITKRCFRIFFAEKIIHFSKKTILLAFLLLSTSIMAEEGYLYCNILIDQVTEGQVNQKYVQLKAYKNKGQKQEHSFCEGQKVTIKVRSVLPIDNIRDIYKDGLKLTTSITTENNEVFKSIDYFAEIKLNGSMELEYNSCSFSANCGLFPLEE